MKRTYQPSNLKRARTHGFRARMATKAGLPEIGDAFGGRDPTTVLHACRKIKELRESELRINGNN